MKSRFWPRAWLAVWVGVWAGAMLTGQRIESETLQALYWMAGVVLIWKSF